MKKPAEILPKQRTCFVEADVCVTQNFLRSGVQFQDLHKKKKLFLRADFCARCYGCLLGDFCVYEN